MEDGPAAGQLAMLRGHRYINLTTFRRNGIAVVTPVWFAVMGDKVYVGTPADSGKMKRIRNNARVQLAPSSARGRAHGPAIEGVARVLPPGGGGPARQALDRKYRPWACFFRLLYRLRRKERALIEIVPG